MNNTIIVVLPNNYRHDSFHLKIEEITDQAEVNRLSNELHTTSGSLEKAVKDVAKEPK